MIIICNGMMRSGSTLQYNIVKELLYQNKKKYAKLGYYNKDKIIQNFVDLENYATDRSTIYLIKTHDFTKLNELDNVFVIYSYRNLLDVAASLKRKFNSEGDDLILTINDNINNYYKIINSPKILIHSYKSLLNSLYNCVEETSSFLKLETSNVILNEITLNNSPKNIIKLQNKKKVIKSIKKSILSSLTSTSSNTKKNIKSFFGVKVTNRLKHKLFPHDQDSLLHLNHISKDFGQNGNWEEILSDKEIKRIKSEFKNWTNENKLEF